MAIFNSRTNHTIYPHSIHMCVQKTIETLCCLWILWWCVVLRMLKVIGLRSYFISGRNPFTFEALFWIIRFLLQRSFCDIFKWVFFLLFITFYYSFQTLHKSRKKRIMRPYVLIIWFWQLSTFFTPLPNSAGVFWSNSQISYFASKYFRIYLQEIKTSFLKSNHNTIAPNKMTKILNIQIVSKMPLYGWFV